MRFTSEGCPESRGWLALIVVALSLLLWPCRGEPWDWHDAPLHLRFGLAFDRVAATYTDVVGLSASGAFPYASSVNPANDDFLGTQPADLPRGVTGSLFYVPFETGAEVIAGALSVSTRVPNAGTASFAYSHSDAHRAPSRQGDVYTLTSQDFTLGYSQPVRSWLALGGELKLTDSSLTVTSRSPQSASRAVTDSLAGDVRLGGLVALTTDKRWLLSLMVGAGWVSADTRIEASGPDAGSLPRVDLHVFTYSVNVRAGAGWRPVDEVGVYVDVEYLRLWTSNESVSAGRVLAGVEYGPTPWLLARLGGSIDTAGAATLSAGLGLILRRDVALDIAYVYNAFPELRHEFGRAQLISAAITFLF